jgi:hypothetical protein
VRRLNLRDIIEVHYLVIVVPWPEPDINLNSIFTYSVYYICTVYMLLVAQQRTEAKQYRKHRHITTWLLCLVLDRSQNLGWE